jgi:hypothetical protein
MLMEKASKSWGVVDKEFDSMEATLKEALKVENFRVKICNSYLLVG